jgi:excisionase family DNA binding protein
MTAALLTVEDVAGLTGLSAYTVRKAIRDGELVASKLRGRIRVDPGDLAAWVDAGRIAPQAEVVLYDATVPPRHPRTSGPASYRRAARDRRRVA